MNWVGDTGGGEIGWLHMRDPPNDRGDSSTVLARKESWETKGIYTDIRAGAWCRPQISTMTVSLCTKMWFMNFASLVDGAKLAWLDPVNKENSFVQNSVARGLPRCKVYRHDTTDFIVTYLVGLGNDTNADAAETNHLQTYRASKNAECSWNRKKRQESWTIEGLGQGTYENVKIEHVNSIFGGSSATARRWQVIGHYERCWGFLMGRRCGPPTTSRVRTARQTVQSRGRSPQRNRRRRRAAPPAPSRRRIA